MSSFQGNGPNNGAKSVRFDTKGTRLLCSEIGKPLVCYNIPTVKHPTASGKVRFSARGYRIHDGSQIDPKVRIMKSPCCFAGDNDELLIGVSDDNGIYVWSAPDGEYQQRKIDRTLRVLRCHRDVVRCVRYSAHSGVLASCGEEGIVKLWSTQES